MSKNIQLVVTLGILLISWNLVGQQAGRYSKENVQCLIFGLDFSECGGDCATLFKIENKQLYEDDINFIVSFDQKIPFKTTPLPQNKYVLAATLLESFPKELLATDTGIIGKPNSHDQGGITLEIKTSKIHKKWYIDTSEKRQPDYLIPYTQEVMQILRQLLDD